MRNFNITVGIPTYNEGKIIGSCLATVLPQLKNDDDQVIIVASGTTDNTIEVVKKWMQLDSRIMLIIESKRKGKASAINIINWVAKGDIVVQTDADVRLFEGAISNILKPFEDPQVGAVSGHPIPRIAKNNVFYEWTHMSYDKLHHIRLKEDEANIFWHLSGYLLAWRSGCLPEVPFCKGAVDAWMGHLINENDGWIIRYAPDAKVLVTAPNNTKDFIAQKARVRAGYHLLPKNKMPRTLKKEIFWFPIEFLKIPVWKWHKFIYSGFVYAYTWWKGKRMAKQNKSLEEIWKVPESTKC